MLTTKIVVGPKNFHVFGEKIGEERTKKTRGEAITAASPGR